MMILENETMRLARRVICVLKAKALGSFVCLAAFASISLQAAPTVAAVVNGASYSSNAPAPGTLVSIYGIGLTNNTASAPSLPLPTVLSGTSVNINAQPIPLLYISPAQINALIPFHVGPGAAVLTVSSPSGTSGSFPLTIAEASPGIFSATANGQGEALAVDVEFNLIRRALFQNARTGQAVVLFCAGLGQVLGFSNAGDAAPSSPLATTALQPEVLMDGRPATVLFSGLAPGFAGLYQINLVVPEGLGGDVPTIISVGGVQSNEVTINVSGVVNTAPNYTGELVSRETLAALRFDLSSVIETSPDIFGAIYLLSSSGATLDSGTAMFGRGDRFFSFLFASNAGGGFVGIGDTLDTGGSFLGILYNSPSFDLVQNADDWIAAFEIVESEGPPNPDPTSPNVPPAGGAYSRTGVTQSLQDTSRDGSVLVLIDCSMWEVSSLDRFKTSIWLPFSNVVVTDKPFPIGDERYVLTRNDQSVSARYLGTQCQKRSIRQRDTSEGLFILDDCSLWEVTSFDRFDTTSWFNFDEIRLLEDRSAIGEFRFLLINVDDGGVVTAAYRGERCAF